MDEPQLLLVSGLTVAVVELAKRLGLPTRIAPALALVAALGIQFLVTPDPIIVRDLVLSALISGLMAAGLYSGTKTTIQK